MSEVELLCDRVTIIRSGRAIVTDDDSSLLAGAVAAGGELLAHTLAMVAVSAFLVGVVPQLRHVAWALPAWALIVGMLAEALRLPEWARDLSPVDLVGQVPAESANPTAIALLLLVGGCLVLTGGVVFTRRDLLRG